jgi:hypothetical protein
VSVERERFWSELLERQARSGQSVRRFCGSAGVSEPSFYLWRKRLRSAKRTSATSTTSGGVPDPSPAVSAPIRRGSRGTSDAFIGASGNGYEFLPLGTLGGGRESVLEIVHPGGCRVRVIGDLNVACLRQVLQTLDQRDAR